MRSRSIFPDVTVIHPFQYMYWTECSYFPPAEPEACAFQCCMTLQIQACDALFCGNIEILALNHGAKLP